MGEAGAVGAETHEPEPDSGSNDGSSLNEIEDDESLDDGFED